MKAPLSARIGRVLLALVCAAGVAAGAFLLLCGVGILSPEALSQQVAAWLEPAEAAAPASAAPAQPVPAEEAAPFQGVFLPLEDLDRATELAAGKDGVVLPMKDPDGSLGYVSAVALAADVGASSGDPDRNEGPPLPQRHPGAVHRGPGFLPPGRPPGQGRSPAWPSGG